MLFHELHQKGYFHALAWITISWFFMLIHEFEKSQGAAAAAAEQQFSNFKDRGFALAVKKIIFQLAKQTNKFNRHQPDDF